MLSLLVLAASIEMMANTRKTAASFVLLEELQTVFQPDLSVEGLILLLFRSGLC